MALAFRNALTIAEVAARWDATPARLAEWALGDALNLSIVVPTVEVSGTTDPIGNLAEAPGGDLWPLFRSGSPPSYVLVRRLRSPGSPAWGRIVDPKEGLTVTIADVHVTAAEVDRFERGVNPPASVHAAWRSKAGRPRANGKRCTAGQQGASTTTACRRLRPNSSARRSTGSVRRATMPCLTRALSGGSSPASGAR